MVCAARLSEKESAETAERIPHIDKIDFPYLQLAKVMKINGKFL
jgi:hypothetical protein